MGHHSFVDLGGHSFLFCAGGYLPDLAALFTEGERRVVEHEDDGTEFVYATTVAALRDRLSVQGFTAARARHDLAEALRNWARVRPRVDVAVQSGDGEVWHQPTSVQEWRQNPPPAGWTGPVPTADEIKDEFRRRLALDLESIDFEDLLPLPDPDPLYVLLWYLSDRSYLRLLLDCSPSDCAEVSLNLSELTGCCVALPAGLPIADDARAEQLQQLAQNAPLIVITEGTTDSKILTAGMEITHPHLAGFVTFIDYASAKSGGGVDTVARAVTAFTAAGVANRFVALADNDTEGHAGLAKLKSQKLPDRCRILHYPPLRLLESYPTMGPTTDQPVPLDINGRAGSLELYLGRDVLEGDDGQLTPVQWTSWNKVQRRYQGALIDKNAAQERFWEKVKAHKAGKATGNEDWSGIHAIIDSIVTAFDDPSDDPDLIAST